MHTPPSSPPCEPGCSFRPSLACLSSPNSLIDKDGTAHIFDLPTVMDRCLSRAGSGLLHNNEADEDNEVDTGELVDEPADEVDSEAVKRLVDSQVNERAKEIDHMSSEGGNVVSRSVDRATDESNDCLAATSSPPPTYPFKKSQAGATNHFAITWSIIVSTRRNWVESSDKVIQSIIGVCTSTTAWFTRRETQKIFRPSVG